MLETKPVRAGLILGGILALACLLGVWLAWPNRSTSQEKELLVRCDAREVRRVLGRLRGLEVQVLDARTREPVRLPDTDSLGVGLGDALAVVHALRTVAVRAAGSLGPSAPLRVIGMHVKDSVADVEVTASDPAALDAWLATLRQDVALADRRSSVVPMQLEPPGAEGGVWRQRVTVRLLPPADRAELEPGPFLETGRLNELIAAHGGMLTYVSGRRREITGGGLVAVESQRFELRIDTLDAFLALLDDLSREPGMVVTEVRWRLDESEEGIERLKPVRLELSRAS